MNSICLKVLILFALFLTVDSTLSFGNIIKDKESLLSEEDYVILANKTANHFSYLSLPLKFYHAFPDTLQHRMPNKWGMDVTLLSLSIHRSFAIRQRLYLGFEIGVLPGFSWTMLAGKRFTLENTIWSNDRTDASVNRYAQMFLVHAYLRWKPKIDFFELDFGIRRARYLYTVPYEDTRFNYPLFYGAYIKPVALYKRVGLGVRVDIGGMVEAKRGYSEFVIMASPFIRIKFKQ